MHLTIKQEEPKDYKAVFNVIEAAFKNEKLSDNKEQFLVQRLRKSKAFVPELSIVAAIENQIVGYILLSKVIIKNEQKQFNSLALAPIAVLPKYQKKGIGKMLIKHSHNKAKALNFKSIVLLGHQNYYPKFGYQQAHKLGIEFPFKAPKKNCMAIALTENGLKGVNGKVVYPNQFFE